MTMNGGGYGKFSGMPRENKLRKKALVWLAVCLAFPALILWTVWGNKALEVNSYTISCGRIPDSFSGLRIAQVSDLHNTAFGPGNERLLMLLSRSEPDIIVITGDLVDSYRTDLETALAFAAQAAQLAPCYYVTGNHEARIAEYEDLIAGLQAAGVTLLDNGRITLARGGEAITLIGAEDPSFRTDYLTGDSAAVMAGTLQSLTGQDDAYTILLSHRPELFDTYTAMGVDLVFSGHAHGGQFRLPFIGGLVAPNQGLFPAYDSGLYTKGTTNMLVSRGLGNSIFPFRFNNRPEILVVELQAEE